MKYPKTHAARGAILAGIAASALIAGTVSAATGASGTVGKTLAAEGDTASEAANAEASGADTGDVAQKTDLSKTAIAAIPDQQYNGSSLTPELIVTYGSQALVSGVDYTPAYENNIDPGTATVTITGMGNYTGTQTATFNIVKSGDAQTKDIASAEIRTDRESYPMDGTEVRPSVTVTLDGTELKEGTDYTLAYADNTAPGTATVTATGIGAYTGTCSASFTITDGTGGTGDATDKKDISSASVVIKDHQSSFAATGSAIEPEVDVTVDGQALTRDVDYTVAYSDNVDPGTARITVTGIGAYTGTKSAEFAITGGGDKPSEGTDLASATIALDRESYDYTGKDVTPEPVVKMGDETLVKGVDYDVSYRGNIMPGKAQVIVTGRGAYTGSKTKEFTIAVATKFSVYAVDTAGHVGPLKDGSGRMYVFYYKGTGQGGAVVTKTDGTQKSYLGEMHQLATKGDNTYEITDADSGEKARLTYSGTDATLSAGDAAYSAEMDTRASAEELSGVIETARPGAIRTPDEVGMKDDSAGTRTYEIPTGATASTRDYWSVIRHGDGKISVLDADRVEQSGSRFVTGKYVLTVSDDGTEISESVYRKQDEKRGGSTTAGDDDPKANGSSSNGSASARTDGDDGNGSSSGRASGNVSGGASTGASGTADGSSQRHAPGEIPGDASDSDLGGTDGEGMSQTGDPVGGVARGVGIAGVLSALGAAVMRGVARRRS